MPKVYSFLKFFAQAKNHHPYQYTRQNPFFLVNYTGQFLPKRKTTVAKRNIRYTSQDFGIFMVVWTSALFMLKDCSNLEQSSTKPAQHREIPGRKPDPPTKPAAPPETSPWIDEAHRYALV